MIVDIYAIWSMSCWIVFYFHLFKLELLTQFPAPNDETIYIYEK